MLITPSLTALDEHLRSATLHIAQRLHESGAQAWLVGGAVRDMALGKKPKDIDLATDALPDQIESQFERTLSVGKAFGTIIVLVGDAEAQVTTFRAERGHHDGRRPSEVRFSKHLEEDAARRDFTCNAMYLDPLTDALADPCGGWGDLSAGLLRAIGDPRERFAEDGLRLVRMARLAAAHALEPEAHTFAAARECTHALRGVSAERRLGELTAIFERPRAARALELLEHSGVLSPLCPGIDQLRNQSATDWSAFSRLPSPVGAASGFALLFDPLAGPLEHFAPRQQLAAVLLEALRPSRALMDNVRALWRLQRALLDEPAGQPLSRSTAIRIVRERCWPLADALLRARASSPTRRQIELERWTAGLGAEELRPSPLIASADLTAAGVPRGPRFGALLAQAEELQLELVLTSRAQALAWLAERARETDEQT